MNLFEIASRECLRFPSIKGALTVEQLWDLPLTSNSGFDLDSVAKSLNRELKNQAEESFVAAKTNTGKVRLEQKLAIVVHIIETRQAENEARNNAAAKTAERARLKDILALRNEQELMKLSPEDLQTRIDAL